MAILSDIIRFENGEMTPKETVKFFSGLITSGMCWTLQGSYGRTAKMLINSGLINSDGDINHLEFDRQMEDNPVDREEETTRLLNGE